jgi:nucleotide-binding universal stress UspA family protein
MKTILVPTNFSVHATDALVTAASIIRTTGGKLILMHNVETLMTNWSRLSNAEQSKYPDVQNYSDRIYREIQEVKLGGLLYGLPVESMITYGVTSDEIIRAATKADADLIVIGSGYNTSGRDLIGSTLQRVVREAYCPVLSVKKEIESSKWTKVLVPLSLDFDISAPFEEIANICNDLDVGIQLVYINTPQHFEDTDTIKKRLDEFKAKHSAFAIETAVYDHSEIEEGILEFARSSKADCIAMVTFEHNHTPGYQLSVTDYILYHATIPVLAVFEKAAVLRRKATEKLAGSYQPS